jgi:hypothetical protein
MTASQRREVVCSSYNEPHCSPEFRIQSGAGAVVTEWWEFQGVEAPGVSFTICLVAKYNDVRATASTA